MSSIFLNTLGIMAGIDLHDYTIPAGAPLPHVVGTSLAFPICSESKRMGTVTADGYPMLQVGFEVYWVPHVPVEPSPSPTAGAELASIIARSGSKTALAVGTVTAQGKPLSCTVLYTHGLNVDCGSPLSLPSGLVLQCGSVRTQPTAGDFGAAAARWGYDYATGKLTSWFWKKLGLDFCGDATGEAYWKALTKWIERMSKPYVDTGKLREPVADAVHDVIDAADEWLDAVFAD